MAGATEEAWREFLALAHRIDNAALAVAPDGVVELPPPDVLVLSLYWRSVRLFRATRRLLEAGLPEEGLIVARSLFTDALRLLEIAAAGPDRAALVLHWANRSIEDERNLVKKGVSLGLDNDPAPVLEHLAAQQKGLLEHAAKAGVKLRGFQDEVVAAKQFGRKEDCWTYAIAHQMVHGTDLALKYSRRKLQGGTLATSLENRDPGVLVGFGLFAAQSVLDAAMAVAGIFNWPAPEPHLRSDLDGLKQKLDGGADAAVLEKGNE